MKYTLNSNNNPATDKHDCVILPIFTKEKKILLSDAAQIVDNISTNKIQTLLDQGDFKAKTGNTLMLYNLENIKASRVLLLGYGDEDKLNSKSFATIASSACKALKTKNIKNVSFYLSGNSDTQALEVTQSILAFADCLYQLQDYKSKPEDAPLLEELVISSTTDFSSESQTALKHSIAITKGMKLSRDMANHPGNICTPSFLANTAEELSKTFDSIQLEVLEEKDMEKLGMGAFLSVSKGSDELGKMIVLQYQGASDKSEAPIALVGKGVTFDTGGISLKPGANMDEMKFDMSGAAGMLGTLKACAEMELPINLVIILAAAENMPSGRATKPGDIVTSMQGTTIEVLNTDAEGRLVLCDALSYVGKYKPRVVIDAATLTGACIIALGHHISAILSNNDELVNDLSNAGEQINDPIWQLPMGEDYKKQLKSSFADLGNIGGRAAGTITAACFLGEFTKDYKWAHLDIAGTAWSGKDSTGRPVPLLSQYLINQANS